MESTIHVVVLYRSIRIWKFVVKYDSLINGVFNLGTMYTLKGPSDAYAFINIVWFDAECSSNVSFESDM